MAKKKAVKRSVKSKPKITLKKIARKSSGKKSIKKNNVQKGAIKLPSLKARCNSSALAFTLAILSAAGMLLMSLLGKMGIGLGAVETMQKFHFFYTLSWLGILGGMMEAALWGLIIGYLGGWLYNKFV